MVLDDDGRPKARQPQLKNILGAIKAASPVPDGAKPESPNHALDDLIMYSPEVASKLDNLVAPGFGNILDEVIILGSIPVAVEPEKVSAMVDNQGELILDSIEPDDFIVSEEPYPSPVSLSPPPLGSVPDLHPFDREGAPSPESFLTTSLQLSPPASSRLASLTPRGGGRNDHEGTNWSMFEQRFSFNARNKRSSSDGSIDLYAIPEYQPTRSFEDIMREIEEDEGDCELISGEDYQSNVEGSDEYAEDSLGLGWYQAEDDDIPPTESTFELIYSDILTSIQPSCQPIDYYALAEQQPELCSNSQNINMEHSREHQQHHDPDWNQIQSVDYNIDPALLIPTPLSPYHPPPSISTPILRVKSELSHHLDQDTTTPVHPYYHTYIPATDLNPTTPPPSPSSSSSSSEQQSPSPSPSDSDSDSLPLLQSPRSTTSSSDSGDDSWCEYPDNPDHYDERCVGEDGSGEEEEEERGDCDDDCYCQYRQHEEEEVHVDAVIEAAEAAAAAEEVEAGVGRGVVGGGEGEAAFEEEEEEEGWVL
jgi:hypothetical protein